MSYDSSYSSRPHSPQELLEMAYSQGRYRRELKKELEPLNYVAWLVQYYAPYSSELFLQKVVEWYEAGYNGLTLAPTQWQ